MTEPLYHDEQYTQWAGDNETILKEVPEHSVDCIVTSPPYLGLRSYKVPDKVFDGNNGCEHEWGEEIKTHKGHPGTKSNLVGTQTSKLLKDANSNGHFCLKCEAWRGQLGGEPHPDLYIAHLCDTFDLCKQVLKKTGSLWVNINDSYAGSGSPGGDFRDGKGGDEYLRPYKRNSMLSKSLMAIPARFQIEMSSRGWICRNVIIWRKPNPMPSSSNDRFCNDFEYLYFFVQSQKYYFEMQYEPMKRPEATFNPDTSNHSTLDLLKEGNRTTTRLHDGRTQYGSPGLGRHLRSVWSISTKGVKGLTHHAVFPTGLCTTPIRVSCPEFVCTKCGQPRLRIYKDTSEYDVQRWGKQPSITGEVQGVGKTSALRTGKVKIKEFIGLSNCGCGEPFKPGIVLDPFGGSGTVALEARRLAREAWMIDISKTYAKEAVERVTKLENPFDR